MYGCWAVVGLARVRNQITQRVPWSSVNLAAEDGPQAALDNVDRAPSGTLPDENIEHIGYRQQHVLCTTAPLLAW